MNADADTNVEDEREVCRARASLQWWAIGSLIPAVSGSGMTVLTNRRLLWHPDPSVFNLPFGLWAVDVSIDLTDVTAATTRWFLPGSLRVRTALELYGFMFRSGGWLGPFAFVTDRRIAKEWLDRIRDQAGLPTD